MSRIDALIAEICPEGVEFKEIGSLIKINFGERITKLEHLGTLYPVYGGGGESFRTDLFNRENEYVVSRFAMSERCVRRVAGKFWMLDSGFTFDPIDESIDKDFIAYLLFNMQAEIYACSSQGAQKNLQTDAFKQLRIPVPPLEVQLQIVKVLDAFTELEARRRQYKYYRDALLAFSDQDIRWAAMAEVGEFFRGRRFTKADYVDAGIECIHYGDIYTQYGTVAETAVSHVRTDMPSTLRFARPGDLIIAGVGETVEDVGKAVAWLGHGEVAIHDDCFAFRHSLNPRFVSYYFQSTAFHAEKNKFVARAKVKRLSAESLAKLTIPVPSPEEQARIVAILDKFDALVNDISVGLPAEIAARRQQYAHYRARLLTFKEAA